VLSSDELDTQYPEREIKLPPGVLYDLIWYDPKTKIYYTLPGRHPRHRTNNPDGCPGCELIKEPEVIMTPDGMKPKWTNLDNEEKKTYIKKKSGNKFRLECKWNFFI
jgi:hypothetical protein